MFAETPAGCVAQPAAENEKGAQKPAAPQEQVQEVRWQAA